ncbi:ATP-binding protein [Polymorphospora sp. NPDC051019]|uniref:AAA family ATPase n=1 Tax=Polymorphospora sp. NPDC051019 TaxID=3155725 RepID=UPI0034431056
MTTRSGAPPRPLLVVFAGLPGVGKSTLARQVGSALRVPVLAVDPVDRELGRHEVTEPRPGHAAYGIVAAQAETQLGMGVPVVVDAVNPVAATRRLWQEIADRTGVPLRVVEVWCGDETEHRRRVESRLAEEGGAGTPDWAQVVGRRAEYEPYVGPRLIVDTAVSGDPLPGLLAYLR